MLSVREADELLASLALPGGTEPVGLEQAVGRVTSADIVADRDGPPYHRVAMDGYAVLAAEGAGPWVIEGQQFAGAPPVRRTGLSTAIEVATGGVLPENCDVIIPYEDTEKIDGSIRRRSGSPPLQSGRHFHRQGTDYLSGQVLIPAATRLRSAHLHALATVGTSVVEVRRRPSWALAATGDELVEISASPLPWQIRRSNAAAIAGEAHAWGLAPREQAVLRDEKFLLREGLQNLLPGLDVLVLTGGVSAGALDLVPQVLNELGAVTLFHKVAQRPGKPLWCGRFPDQGGRPGTLVFGLPGNPVSSLFAFRRYVLPWLLRAEGRVLEPQRVSAAALAPPPPGTTVFLPWSTTQGLLPWTGSGDFHALGDSTGFIEIDDDPRSLTAPLYHPWGGTP